MVPCLVHSRWIVRPAIVRCQRLEDLVYDSAHLSLDVGASQAPPELVHPGVELAAPHEDLAGNLIVGERCNATVGEAAKRPHAETGVPGQLTERQKPLFADSTHSLPAPHVAWSVPGSR